MKTVRMKTRNIFEGGPPHVLCYGTQQLMFYCIFKEEFSEFIEIFSFIGSTLSKKSAKIRIEIRKVFQKVNVFRFKMVSN